MKKILSILLAAVVALGCCTAQAKKMSDLKIYINPGHGGYTSNDRNIPIYPYETHDTLGYWESKSNLYKGLHMYHILDSLGAKPYLSRIKNRKEDNRNLSEIAAEANSLGVDLFFSIHSNAGEDVNYPLMLYREQTIGTPRYPENVTLSEILGRNLYSNQLPVWTHPLQIAGDLTFYQNMWQGGLGVLRTLYVVGLLSEGGMHEHRPEAYRLMNDDYWWLEAWHFCRSIMEFYDTEDRFVTGNIAGIVYDDHNLREKDMPVIFHNYKRDRFAPVNGCHIELIDGNGKTVQTRTTDQIYNGVFVFRNVSPGQYTLRTSHPEYYPVETEVSVTANEVTYNDLPLMMRREFPLQVLSYSPQAAEGEEVSCATTIEFDFNSDIDEAAFEKAFKIEPPVEGFFTYSKNLHHVTFTPSVTFERLTKYTVTLGKEACTPDRQYSHPGMEEDLVFTFNTKGRSRLEMVDQFPRPDGEIHYAAPTVEFRFDNTLDKTGIYDLITITDPAGQALTVNKRNCKFNQLSNNYGNAIFAFNGDLTPGTTYTVHLSGDIKDKELLPTGQPLEYTFKAVDATAQDEHKAAVAMDFEREAPFAFSADHSQGLAPAVPPTCKTSTAAKIGGVQSAKFTYQFADARGGEAVWLYDGSEPTVLSSSDVVTLYVNGDFNNHDLYLGVTSGTDIKWLPVTTTDFTGWRFCSVSLESLDPSFTYLLEGFKLVQQPSLITQKGAFSIDDLGVDSSNGVTDITADGIESEMSPLYDLQGRPATHPTAPGVYVAKDRKVRL